jgi:hypothetical protein
MLVNHIESLAFGQYVIEETTLAVALNRVEPFLAIVPDSYQCVASACAAGQPVFVWAAADSVHLYVVLPGVAIYAAQWHQAVAKRPSLHPALVVAASI